MNSRCDEILTQIDALLYHQDPNQTVLQHLKREYNAIVGDIYANTDEIIQEALPKYGYASSLLIFTIVSNKWRNILISFPSLWAHIEISEHYEDVLATIETFTHLSQALPLQAIIFAPINNAPSFLGPTLANIATRLEIITIVYDPNSASNWWNTADLSTHTVFEQLLEMSQHIKNVKSINIDDIYGRPMHNRSLANKMLDTTIPPGIKMIQGWFFSSEELYSAHSSLGQLQSMDTRMPFETLLIHLDHFSQLRTLNISSPETDQSDIVSGNHIPVLPKLSTLTYHSQFSDNLLTFLGMVGPNLVELDILVPCLWMFDLFRVLCTATQMRLLSIRLWAGSSWTQSNGSIIINSSDIYQPIPGLQRLNLTIEKLPDNEMADRVRHFVLCVTSIYLNVEEVSFDIDDTVDVMSAIVEYLFRLRRLRVLSLDGCGAFSPFQWSRELSIPTLDELQLDEVPPGVLPRLHAPSLLSLELQWNESYEERDIYHLDPRQLRIFSFGTTTIKLPEACFPSTETLALTFFHNRGGGLYLSGFYYLTTLSISSPIGGNQATLLCLTLLYNAQASPNLEGIKFIRCPPDWDLLFLMLEVRNFAIGRTMSRIKRISLPMIPYHLRIPLAALLRGLFPTRPSNEDISFYSSRELMFNANVNGCYTCLRNLLGSCKERPQLSSNHVPPTTDGCICSMEDLPPPVTVKPIIKQWIYKRETLRHDWDLSFAKWGSTYRRVHACAGSQGKTPIEITEHDYK